MGIRWCHISLNLYLFMWTNELGGISLATFVVSLFPTAFNCKNVLQEYHTCRYVVLNYMLKWKKNCLAFYVSFFYL